MIYDKFTQDSEWSRLNEALHVPGLTYRERDVLRASLDAREQAIRKREKAKWLAEVNRHIGDGDDFTYAPYTDTRDSKDL
jgi:hypothetical protein